MQLPRLPQRTGSATYCKTDLSFDIEAGTGAATILFATGEPGASLEVGDLELLTVKLGEAPLPFRVTDSRLDRRAERMTENGEF
ncbi:MAG: hypothetical protein GY811_07565 [Myxococcales bacterium]|nr:hypothetical protein [Myxococcales bacterium]